MKTTTDKRVQLQALRFNQSGQARTIDHKQAVKLAVGRGRGKGRGKGLASEGYMLDVPKPNKGRGACKKWTGEAICQAAYAPPEQPGRTVAKSDGASHAHVRGCASFCANMVEMGQIDHYGKRLRESSGLDFYITNNMFDSAPGPGEKLHCGGMCRCCGAARGRLWCCTGM